MKSQEVGEKLQEILKNFAKVLITYNKYNAIAAQASASAKAW
jgi:hypothetical protein